MKRKPYYGWAIASMGTLGNALQGGLIFWSMGMYSSAFEEAFGASRTKIAGIETGLTVGVNVLSPLLGLWVDKGSARHAVALGAVSLGSGLILLSLAAGVFQTWLLFATLIPLGALSLGMLPSSAIISRWFRRRRGVALGISLAGTSIGGALAPPLLAFLFAAYGWRTALMIVGIVVIALAPVFFMVVANSPEEKGVEPEDAPPTANTAESMPDAREWGLFEMFTTRALYLQTIFSGCLLAVSLGLITNLSFHLKDLGFNGTQVGFMYSVIASCSFGGKLLFGALADRFGANRSGLLAVSMIVTGLVIFVFAREYLAILCAAAAMGTGMGGNTPVWTSIIARDFGPKSFGRALGVQSPMHIPITAPSAPLAAYFATQTGSYDVVFLAYLGMCGIAMLALLLMRAPASQRAA